MPRSSKPVPAGYQTHLRRIKMKNLYRVAEIHRTDYILAENISDAIKMWKEFYNTNDDPGHIALVSGSVIVRK